MNYILRTTTYKLHTATYTLQNAHDRLQTSNSRLINHYYWHIVWMNMNEYSDWI